MIQIPTHRRVPCVLPTLLIACMLPTQVLAQAATASRPDPLNSNAQIPALRYESTFTQFRRTGDDKPVAWREANDAVARIGGWRVYAREAQQPDAVAPKKSTVPTQAPASAPVPAAKPLPPASTGHKH